MADPEIIDLFVFFWHLPTAKANGIWPQTAVNEDGISDLSVNCLGVKPRGIRLDLPVDMMWSSEPARVYAANRH